MFLNTPSHDCLVSQYHGQGNTHTSYENLRVQLDIELFTKKKKKQEDFTTPEFQSCSCARKRCSQVFLVTD